MAKLTVTCLQLVTAICVVQTIQIIATIDMHQDVWAEERGEWRKLDRSQAAQFAGLAYMFTLIATCFLVIYNEPCGYFVRFEAKSFMNFKLQFWLWIFFAAAWIGVPVWLFAQFSLKLALLDTVFVLLTAFSILLIPYKLWRQKEEFEDFVERAIELNSTEGREMSLDQAHTLYKLHNYRKLTRQLHRRRENSKSKNRNGTPRGFQQFRAINFDDFFLLSSWIHQLEQTEKTGDFQQKMINEMRARLNFYDLSADEKENLSVLARWNGLQIPEEDWHCGAVIESLNGEKRVAL